MEASEFFRVGEGTLITNGFKKHMRFGIIHNVEDFPGSPGIAPWQAFEVFWADGAGEVLTSIDIFKSSFTLEEA